MKSRKAVRLSVLINVLCHIMLTIALLNWVARRFAEQEGDMSSNLVVYGRSWHTVFIIFALVSFFVAKKSKSQLNLVLVMLNCLMALYTLAKAAAFV